jgi:hypothetical protein
MRSATDKAKLLTFIREVGLAARGPGSVYLVGGSTALLLGIREQTIDVDIKLDPEPKGVFEAIAKLKEQLDLNIELASPDQFLPALPGWKDRSEFIAESGQVTFFHYDFYGQAMAKILRGHHRDLNDVRALVQLGKVQTSRLQDFYNQIEHDLIRFPAINVEDFKARLASFIAVEGAAYQDE